MRMVLLLSGVLFVAVGFTAGAEPLYQPTGRYVYPVTGKYAPDSLPEPKPTKKEDDSSKPVHPPTPLDVLKQHVEKPNPKTTVRHESYAAYSPWYVNGHNTSDGHLIHTHGVSPDTLKGLTQDEKNRLHGKMHGEQPRTTTTFRPVVRLFSSGGCPGGVCPMQATRRRR